MEVEYFPMLFQEYYKSFVLEAMKKTNDDLQFYKGPEKVALEIKQKCNEMSVFQHLQEQVRLICSTRNKCELCNFCSLRKTKT